MKKLNNILLAIGLFALTGVASATVITGSIDFAGSATALDGTSNLDATQFSFNNPTSVTEATGSFLPLSGLDVTYNNLDLNAMPAAPLWSRTLVAIPATYSFDLENIVDDVLTTVGSKTTRSIYGTGTFTIIEDSGTSTGWGDWLFTTQQDGGGTFSFSVAQVPEPGIALLLSIGLIGFGVSRRMRKSA